MEDGEMGVDISRALLTAVHFDCVVDIDEICLVRMKLATGYEVEISVVVCALPGQRRRPIRKVVVNISSRNIRCRCCG